MRIGVDFDNTIVCCDPLFHLAALERKLIPATLGTSKSEVRDYLRRNGKEPAWTELQGYVYGELLREAMPFPGVLEFFRICAEQKIPICIISHKTKKPFLGTSYDLHKSALDWLEARRFFSEGLLPRDQVYLELSKEAKIDRISKAKCSHFIDDLPEFLSEISFPHDVKRILFDPNSLVRSMRTITRVSSWSEITNSLWKN